MPVALVFCWVANGIIIEGIGTLPVGKNNSQYSYRGTTDIACLGPSVRRTKELLKLKRNQLHWVTGLFTGNCHLKEHFFKMGFVKGV
jgi:hypothetical protein